MPIFEGALQEISDGIWQNGMTGGGYHRWEFIKLGGKRIRHVSTDSYLRSFMKTGRSLKLSAARLGKWNVVVALKTEMGEVIRMERGRIITELLVLLFMYSFIWVFLAAILAIAAGLTFGGYSDPTPIAKTTFVGSFGLLLFSYPVNNYLKIFSARRKKL